MRRNVDFFRIPNSDDTIVFQSNSSSPERRDTGAGVLEKGSDILQRLEVVPLKMVSEESRLD